MTQECQPKEYVHWWRRRRKYYHKNIQAVQQLVILQECPLNHIFSDLISKGVCAIHL